jgi:hypothetical protein
LRAGADLQNVKVFNARTLAFLQLVDAVGNGSDPPVTLTWVTTPALKSVLYTLPCAVRDPCAALYIRAYQHIRSRVAAAAHTRTRRPSLSPPDPPDDPGAAR